ncbi:deoxyribose-phosphate aldolase, partial [Enterococcus sp. S181_ASV_20]|nr:deoxyribose-phosphate aldolase [Enterococcus sp. S181_ASV_20]
AKKYRFYSVCINPTWVSLAAKELQGEPVAVCTVIGFPLGANTTETKAFEAANAIQNGADEVDMVINIGELKDGNDEKVQKDIEAVSYTHL